MTRRLEAGPLLVTLGAVLLVVSLFLDWFSGGLTAWDAFETWDLVLLVLGVGGIVLGIGLALPDLEALDRRWLPAGVAAVAVIVAAQIINPPPTAAGQHAAVGAWLALGAALVMCLGSILTFGRIRFAVMVEGRERRQHVSAVDARGEPEPTTDTHPAVAPSGREEAGSRLFGRDRPAGEETAATAPVDAPAATAAKRTTGRPAPGSRRPRAGDRRAEEKQG